MRQLRSGQLRSRQRSGQLRSRQRTGQLRSRQRTGQRTGHQRTGQLRSGQQRLIVDVNCKHRQRARIRQRQIKHFTGCTMVLSLFTVLHMTGKGSP